MKTCKKYILLLVLSFLCLNKVYAECSQSDIDEFKKIEDQYTVTYELDKSTGKYIVSFNAPSNEYVFTMRVTDGVKIARSENNKKYAYIGVEPGKYKVDVVKIYNDGATVECSGKLKTVELELGSYNKYSESPKCENNKEFYLCQDTYDEEIDEETFESRIELYEESKEEKNQSNNSNNNSSNNKTNNNNLNNNEVNSFIESIMNYLKDNIVIVIGITVTIIVVIIALVVFIKRANKRRRLE